ncbi:GTP 3',8-cyclase MoaA [Mycoplasma sp. P36-A1]|uniref:GTP 3',8-cyclase MoaA n=1 Tax=Mycoplasma sp. P36-A1 TaxID=3252900 RepID=UPI003C2B7511
MRDSYKREIDYARISLLDNCNMKCLYCYDEKNKTNNIIEYDNVINIINVLDTLKFKKVRFTGGEPLLHPDIEKIIEYTNKYTSINDIGITTNGIGLIDKVQSLKKAGLKRINVSLDSLKLDKFNRITKSDKLPEIIEGILKAKSIGLTVKINVVLMEANKREIKSFLEFSKKHDILVRFIEIMPFCSNTNFYDKQKMSIFDYFEDIKYHKANFDTREVAKYYYTDDNILFGIILPISTNICRSCNRIRFTSDLKIRTCLHNNIEVDLSDCINNPNKLENIIVKSLKEKPAKHELLNDKLSQRSMNKIGG